MIEFGPGGKGHWGIQGNPPDPTRAIVAAVLPKIEKRYSERRKTILVVDWAFTSVFHPSEPSHQWDLTGVGEQLAQHGCEFREVWAAILDPIGNRGRAERLFPSPWPRSR